MGKNWESNLGAEYKLQIDVGGMAEIKRLKEELESMGKKAAELSEQSKETFNIKRTLKEIKALRVRNKLLQDKLTLIKKINSTTESRVQSVKDFVTPIMEARTGQVVTGAGQLNRGTTNAYGLVEVFNQASKSLNHPDPLNKGSYEWDDSLQKWTKDTTISQLKEYYEGIEAQQAKEAEWKKQAEEATYEKRMDYIKLWGELIVDREKEISDRFDTELQKMADDNQAKRKAFFEEQEKYAAEQKSAAEQEAKDRLRRQIEGEAHQLKVAEDRVKKEADVNGMWQKLLFQDEQKAIAERAKKEADVNNMWQKLLFQDEQKAITDRAKLESDVDNMWQKLLFNEKLDIEKETAKYFEGEQKALIKAQEKSAKEAADRAKKEADVEHMWEKLLFDKKMKDQDDLVKLRERRDKWLKDKLAKSSKKSEAREKARQRASEAREDLIFKTRMGVIQHLKKSFEDPLLQFTRSMETIYFTMENLSRVGGMIVNAGESMAEAEYNQLSAQGLVRQFGEGAFAKEAKQIMETSGFTEGQALGQIGRLAGQLKSQEFSDNGVQTLMDDLIEMAYRGIGTGQAKDIDQAFSKIENILAGDPQALERFGVQIDRGDIESRYSTESEKTRAVIEEAVKYLRRNELSENGLVKGTINQQMTVLKNASKRLFEKFYLNEGGKESGTFKELLSEVNGTLDSIANSWRSSEVFGGIIKMGTGLMKELREHAAGIRGVIIGLGTIKALTVGLKLFVSLIGKVFQLPVMGWEYMLKIQKLLKNGITFRDIFSWSKKGSGGFGLPVVVKNVKDFGGGKGGVKGSITDAVMMKKMLKKGWMKHAGKLLPFITNPYLLGGAAIAGAGYAIYKGSQRFKDDRGGYMKQMNRAGYNRSSNGYSYTATNHYNIHSSDPQGVVTEIERYNKETQRIERGNE